MPKILQCNFRNWFYCLWRLLYSLKDNCANCLWNFTYMKLYCTLLTTQICGQVLSELKHHIITAQTSFYTMFTMKHTKFTHSLLSQSKCFPHEQITGKLAGTWTPALNSNVSNFHGVLSEKNICCLYFFFSCDMSFWWKQTAEMDMSLLQEMRK
jgi:hypothetical protein